jgi:hypothetical protein
MTKVLAFDIGTRNLAFCMVDHDGAVSPTILDWGLIDLGIKKGASPKTIHSAVKRLIHDRFSSDPSVHVVIESQAVARQVMKTIATVIFSQFHMAGFAHVSIISARQKLSCASPDTIKTYEQRKAQAILHTSATLTACPHNVHWLTELFNLARKKDDLADAYLTALAYLRKKYPNDPLLRTTSVVPI